ncbi:DUF6404 family protein [Jeongeupia sp. USM3]|uniref:DUF6404 family protein n=1 Tax=Jeongeupia sp. USM3 TaxID=1906741 RepID=UPI00089DEE5D|nr:DUF6404 family protein [Jeongeupia sp. USM3]AOY01405.1 hypothetical protein BJP62_13670 [Jeongeupia sp. USM3]
MSSVSQRDRALALLAKTGIWSGNYQPLLFRLLWRLGFNVPPPHFAGFGTAVLLSGLEFACIWGGFMWFVVWRSSGMSAMSAVSFAGATGALFGLVMGLYYAYGRKKHHLPPWQTLG